jgi:hypothetical protein
MAVETVDYNGYRLEIVAVGKGWRVYLPSRLNLAVARKPVHPGESAERNGHCGGEEDC